MCGIAGFINAAAPGGLLDAQLDLILHRGPDGEGRYEKGAVHLGMRRLSIIDLAGGWQPLLGRGGRVLAFQNGEIYNFRRVRADLEALGYHFVTHSDTEVLAHGYDAWGIEGLLRRIDGMYAIAIADLDTQRLHLARDRFGEKPLYFAYRRGSFVYGSSLKSVAAAPWIDLAIDQMALERYLACHFVSGRRTLLSDVSKLLPGERLEIDLAAEGPPVSHRYYRPALVPEQPIGIGELEGLLDEAVESRLVADVPVGLFLSGGIDSSIIAALAARRHKGIEAFCIGFGDPDADESKHAQAVAWHLGIPINTYQFNAKHFTEMLPTVCAALDEPIGDQAILPLHWLAQSAAERVKVVLSGEGADEIFAGYGYYSSDALATVGNFTAAYNAANDVRAQASGLLVEPAGETQSGFPLLTFKHERETIIPKASGMPDAFERDLVGWLAGAHHPLQRRGAADLASWLADDLLVKADRMTMAASLEARAPFLAPPVVERALGLPVGQKFRQGESKVALRQLARRLLPSSIVDRPKHGFVLPMTQWVHEWFGSQGGFAAYVDYGAGLGLNVEALRALHDESGNQHRERLWFAVIALLEWWKAFERDVAHARVLRNTRVELVA